MYKFAILLIDIYPNHVNIPQKQLVQENLKLLTTLIKIQLYKNISYNILKILLIIFKNFKINSFILVRGSKFITSRVLWHIAIRETTNTISNNLLGIYRL